MISLFNEKLMSHRFVESFDAIVVGSGIGGLTAAGLLGAAGYSVLVLEQHDRPGGYAHGFRRKRYHFDSAVHLTSGCGAFGYPGGQVIYKTLKALGVLEEIDFIRVDPFAVAVYPGIRAALPQTIDAFVRAMARSFPQEVAGLRAFIELTVEVAQEASNADEIMARDGPAGIRKDLPALLKYRRSTLAEVCAEFLRDPGLTAILTVNWPYLGLPPSRVSFVYWSTMFIGYLEDGACYCRGGFQQLADTLVSGLKKSGGSIRLKSAVGRILLQDGRVQGVALCNGQRIQAPLVIANSDMRRTVYDLVGKDHFPSRFIEGMERMKPSLSIFVVYIATDLKLEDLSPGHESFRYLDFDHERNYRNSLNGQVTWIGISIPSLADPSLAPQGRHLVTLTTLVPYEIDRGWEQAKGAYVSRMLEIADGVLPGLKTHVLFIEGGSPKTMERYTLNYRGAAYGWELSPDQIGPNRVSNRSAIEGLYFAGHWTAPGGGVYGAAVSGMKTARMVLGIPEYSEFWNRLESNAELRSRIAESKTASRF